MPIVNKTSPELVYEAINEANPDLPVPASAVNVTLGVPAVQTPPGGSTANTKMNITPAGDGTYLGRKEIQYRRRDLSIWFRGMTVRIDAWHAVTNGNTFTLYQLLPRINAKYGLKLTTDDVSDQQFVASPSTLDPQGRSYSTRAMTAKVASLGWIGSIIVEWHNAARSLADAIAINDLPNTRTYPGGNDFSGAHKEVISFMGFGVDWTTWLAANPWPLGYPANFGNNSQSSNQAWLTKYVAEINRIYGTTLDLTHITDVRQGTSNNATPNTSRVLTLPHVDFPELNSRFYNRCLVMPAEANSAKIAGYFALHFNV